MADAQPAPGASPCLASGRAAYPLGPKLRDSCNACAVSKIKCDKVKPSCGRCVTRGVRCEYCFAKRSGRQREDRQRNTAKAPQPQNLEIHTSAQAEIYRVNAPTVDQASVTATVPALPSPSTCSPSTFAYSNAETDNLFASFTSEDPFTSLWSLDNDVFPQDQRSADLGLDFLDPTSFMSVSIPPDRLSTTDGGSIEQPSHARIVPSPESFHSPITSFNSYDGMNSYQSLPSQLNHQLDHQFSHERPPASPQQSEHNCAAQAISHLGQLFQSDPTCGNGLEKNGGEATISSVIAGNKRSIEAIGKILQCFCTKDGYLPLIISIILSKTLDRYATAVLGKMSGSTDSQSPHTVSYQSPLRRGISSTNDDDEEAEECRVAAQLILGELQRVQGLIGLLPQRSETFGSQSRVAGRSTTLDILQGTRILGNSEGQGAADFSGILHQAQDDLRVRVRMLSKEIIDLLRRE